MIKLPPTPVIETGTMVALLYLGRAFIKYATDIMVVAPAVKWLEHHPIIHAQFLHYHERHTAKNPRQCREGSCAIIPDRVVRL